MGVFRVRFSVAIIKADVQYLRCLDVKEIKEARCLFAEITSETSGRDAAELHILDLDICHISVIDSVHAMSCCWKKTFRSCQALSTWQPAQ